MFIKMVFMLFYSILNLSLVTAVPRDGLLCAYCNDILLSFNTATEYPSKCEGQFIKAADCQAIFYMDYLTKEIYLQFTGGYDPIGNYRLELHVENKFDEPKIMNVNITYTCNTTYDCAKQFYQSTIQKLIQNESILNEMRAKLYDPTVLNVQQCSNKQDQPITCQNGYGCHGYEIIMKGMTTYQGECRNISTMTIFPRLYFEITLEQGDPPISTDWNHVGFTCNKQNLCNNRQHIKKMAKLANDFYPWELIEVNSNAKVFMTYNYHLLVAVMLAVYIFF